MSVQFIFCNFIKFIYWLYFHIILKFSPYRISDKSLLIWMSFIITLVLSWGWDLQYTVNMWGKWGLCLIPDCRKKLLSFFLLKIIILTISMAFCILLCVLSLLVQNFKINWCWNLSNMIFEIIVLLLFFKWLTVSILPQIFSPQMVPTLSWHIILLKCYWILLVSIILNKI